MRIYMQSSDYTETTPRFLQLVLQQELLGGWSLVSESGRQGSRGRIKREDYATHELALDALLRMRDAHLQKGFRVVFLQGDVLEDD